MSKMPAQTSRPRAPRGRAKERALSFVAALVLTIVLTPVLIPLVAQALVPVLFALIQVYFSATGRGSYSDQEKVAVLESWNLGDWGGVLLGVIILVLAALVYGVIRLGLRLARRGQALSSPTTGTSTSPAPPAPTPTAAPGVPLLHALKPENRALLLPYIARREAAWLPVSPKREGGGAAVVLAAYVASWAISAGLQFALMFVGGLDFFSTPAQTEEARVQASSNAFPAMLAMRDVPQLAVFGIIAIALGFLARRLGSRNGPFAITLTVLAPVLGAVTLVLAVIPAMAVAFDRFGVKREALRFGPQFVLQLMAALAVLVVGVVLLVAVVRRARSGLGSLLSRVRANPSQEADTEPAASPLGVVTVLLGVVALALSLPIVSGPMAVILGIASGYVALGAILAALWSIYSEGGSRSALWGAALVIAGIPVVGLVGYVMELIG